MHLQELELGVEYEVANQEPQALFMVILHHKEDDKRKGENMRFCIQVSNPKITGTFNPDDQCLDECLQEVFLLETEMALIQWDDVFIPLTYKYTISTIMDDVLGMLENILDNEQGQYTVTMPSNEFHAEWDMSWDSKNLVIDAKWESVIGSTEAMLNSRDPLKIGKTEFLNEWKALLEVVLNGLNACGYSESANKNISHLREIYSRIEKYGVLY